MSDPDFLRFERYRDAAPSRLLRGYYAVRPLLPRRVQIALRRAYAHRQARRSFPAWPIEDSLVRAQQEAWRAQLAAYDEHGVPVVHPWPQGRRFAAVLTHDVEGPAGIANIGAVRALEERRGVFSSWNFCAQDYPIPEGLFDELRRSGCEIGLHGLDHRCRLFTSRADFERQLPRIHEVVREWGVDGFRSPALHRNADWMDELGVRYDSSFPDTDPYEPQPGGCCSILPYFLGDTVELPVTLAQDHTLFEILRHRDIDVWREKAAWIIRHHGLVNVIVHPDYLLTEERLGLYDELLAFLVGQEGGWLALPREVADWWRVREGLRIEGAGASARVVGPGAERAVVSYAREEAGEMVLRSTPLT